MEAVNNSFNQAKLILECTSNCSYPQHIIISEEEFLEDINIKRINCLKINTTIDNLNFSEIGEYPVLVTLFDCITKEYMAKVIVLTVYPSKREYALLKKAYWRAYGLVCEGKFSYIDTHLPFKNEMIYNLELVALDSNYSKGKIYSFQKKQAVPLQEKFHFVLDNQYLESLSIGNYRFQIKASDKKSGHTHISRILEKEKSHFFSVYPLKYSVVEQLEKQILKEKQIYIYLIETGELQMCVRYKE